jgi:O-antigen ligase
MPGRADGGSRRNDATGYDRLNFILTALLLVACLMLGGGGGWFGDTLAQLLSLPILVLAGFRKSRLPREPWLYALLAGIALLAILQLVPLPPGVWQSLPGRHALANEMVQAGVATDTWHSLTLSSIATERALLWMLPGIAMLLSTLAMSAHQRGWLVLVLLGFAIASLLLGLAQLAGGPDSGLRMYRPTSVLDAVGFFSNRDHFASFIAMAIPLAVGWLALAMQPAVRGQRMNPGWIVFLCLTIIALLLALLLSHSRAGLLLAVLALAASVALLLRSGLSRRMVLMLSAVGLVGVLLVAQLGLNGVLDRMDKNLANDPRWTIHANTLDAARHFWPFGSGLGTFVAAYQTSAPERNLQSHFVNHANSDYYELWLEGGWPALLLIGGFLTWYLSRTMRIWLRSAALPPTPALTMARAASISLALVLLHSTMDYPLRKSAIIAVFGLCCALLASADSEASAT